MTKRRLIVLGFLVPVLALLSLLAWASITSGGQPGSLGVNNDFGEIEIAKDAAPQFGLDLFQGGRVELAQLDGMIVFLDFWASWCAPCRQEAPELGEVYREYQGRPVEFLGVNIWDDSSAAQDYLILFDVPYPNGRDADGTVAIDYGVRGIPEKFFIGPSGSVLKKFVGPISGADLRQVLDDLLLQHAGEFRAD